MQGSVMLDYIFNPTKNKAPKGVCKKGTKIKYNLKISKCTKFISVRFLLHKDDEYPKAYEMSMVFADDKYLYFEIEHEYKTSGHYWYHFEIVKENETIRLISGDGLDAVVGQDDKDFLELVIDKDSDVDEHFRRGVIYHIFVDRFCKVGEVKPERGLTLVKDWNEPVDYEFDEKGERVNRFCYGGNFEGIISKLEYLKKLGVTTIYLSPIFEANSSHKYNTANYSKIDEMFGGAEGFSKLLLKAKKLNINIILDGVFNHTGSDSIYFNKLNRYDSVGAYQSKNSPYFKWYNFERFPDKYDTWWGVPTLPQVNEHKSFTDFIAGENGIIDKCMKMGVFGFRLDVADELSDDFLRKINKSIKATNPKSVVIGEVWENASSKISYGERKKYFIGGELDGVTNYPMKNAIINFVKNGDETELVTIINTINAEYPKGVAKTLMNILGSHDTMRIMTALSLNENESDIKIHYLSGDEYERGFKLLKLATILQFTTLGVPTIYYGDEVGMTGGRDPFCRGSYPWGNEKKEVLSWYQKISHLREIPAIYDGDLNILFAENGVIAYERVCDKNKVVVIVNRSDDDYTFICDGKLHDLIDKETYANTVSIPPYGYLVAQVK